MTALDYQPFFYFGAAASFILGLAFGSFLNVCIYRMPRELSVVRPRSACPDCKASIRAIDNVPVLSWLVLRGQCRSCKRPISPRYLIVELLTAMLFLACFLRWEFSLEAIKYCVFSFLILGLIVTDIDCKLLPDRITLPGLGLGLLFAIFVPVEKLASAWIPFTLWQHVRFDVAWRLQSLVDSLAGAALGAFLIWAAGFIYLKLRGVEGMGLGDVKMMAMVGAFLGMEMTLFTIGAAALGASVFGFSMMLAVWIKRSRRRLTRAHQSMQQAVVRAWHSAALIYRHYEIPFGAFLGAMAVVAFLCGNALLRWYMHLWMRP